MDLIITVVVTVVVAMIFLWIVTSLAMTPKRTEWLRDKILKEPHTPRPERPPVREINQANVQYWPSGRLTSFPSVSSEVDRYIKAEPGLITSIQKLKEEIKEKTLFPPQDVRVVRFKKKKEVTDGVKKP